MSQHTVQRNFLFGLMFIALAFAATAHADAPTVTSFTADTQSLSSGYSTALSWNTASSTGRDFYFNCPLGVTIKKSDGTSFPCNARTAVGGSAVDWASFFFTNVSGTTKNVSVTMYPKDSAGANYDQGARNVTISVDTTAQPITDFSLSTTTVASGAPLILTWKGVDASGVNLQFDCVDSIRIRTSASGTEVLPCGKPARAQDLPISGSFTLYPINSSRSPVTVTALIFPEIGGNTYDATHSKTATFEVHGTPLPKSPSASEFKSSATRPVSGDSFDLSWTTRDSASANIKFLCREGLAVFASSSAAKIKLPCDAPAFSTPLATQGTTTILATIAGNYATNLEVMLFPQDASGIYFQTASLSLTIPILPAGTISTAPVQPQVLASTTVSSPSATTTMQTSASSTKTSAKKYTFARFLWRGSRNADVTALQRILAQYPDIYPGGVVSGFFGPSTEQALKLFQEKYGIAKKGAPGYGTVGPNTRAKLNSLQ